MKIKDIITHVDIKDAIPNDVFFSLTSYWGLKGMVLTDYYIDKLIERFGKYYNIGYSNIKSMANETEIIGDLYRLISDAFGGNLTINFKRSNLLRASKSDQQPFSNDSNGLYRKTSPYITDLGLKDILNPMNFSGRGYSDRLAVLCAKYPFRLHRGSIQDNNSSERYWKILSELLYKSEGYGLMLNLANIDYFNPSNSELYIQKFFKKYRQNLTKLSKILNENDLKLIVYYDLQEVLHFPRDLVNKIMDIRNDLFSTYRLINKMKGGDINRKGRNANANANMKGSREQTMESFSVYYIFNNFADFREFYNGLVAELDNIMMHIDISSYFLLETTKIMSLFQLYEKEIGNNSNKTDKDKEYLNRVLLKNSKLGKLIFKPLKSIEHLYSIGLNDFFWLDVFKNSLRMVDKLGPDIKIMSHFKGSRAKITLKQVEKLFHSMNWRNKLVIGEGDLPIKAFLTYLHLLSNKTGTAKTGIINFDASFGPKIDGNTIMNMNNYDLQQASNIYHRGAGYWARIDLRDIYHKDTEVSDIGLNNERLKELNEYLNLILTHLKNQRTSDSNNILKKELNQINITNLTNLNINDKLAKVLELKDAMNIPLLNLPKLSFYQILRNIYKLKAFL
ncbi:MAG: hypothetical protein ACTSU2_14565 [Promethearchaeota archaeon]